MQEMVKNYKDGKTLFLEDKTLGLYGHMKKVKIGIIITLSIIEVIKVADIGKIEESLMNFGQ